MNARITLCSAFCVLALACSGGQSPGFDVTTGDTQVLDLPGDQAPEDPSMTDLERDVGSDLGHDAAQDAPQDTGLDTTEPDPGDPGPGGDLPTDVAGQPCIEDDDCEAAVVPPCHALRCDRETHTCVMAVLDGTPCTPSSACEDHGTCRQGECLGEPRNCDDQNPCTQDSCDPAVGCLHEPMEGTCDDGNACTDNDLCLDGVCQGTPTIACACREDADCAAFEDQDLCNGRLQCIESHCQVDPATVVHCDPSGDSFCKTNTCIPATGLCEMTPAHVGEPCEDGNACTVGDLCQDGDCVPGIPAICEDQNPCTQDSCDPASGCVFVPVAGPCDDGNACTEGDSCLLGFCQGTPIVCDDGTPCTLDSCDPATGCVHVPQAGGACDDLDACTINDSCDANGHCVGGGSRTCDDGNPCTDDSCDPAVGCQYRVLNGVPCNDGNACTQGESCQNGSCQGGTPLFCDDGNSCTRDTCDPMTGCLYLAQAGIPCDDRNVCTTHDACDANGGCVGEVVSCDDGNPCTEDSCDPASGCVHLPKDDGTTCDDGNACTLDDRCQAGRCRPGSPKECPPDANPCTAEVCAGSTGECISVPVAGPCDDGDRCTVGDRCLDGRCVGGEQPLPCDDGNPCTDDSCDPASGCVHVLSDDGTPCDDGSACTDHDQCLGGVCTGEGIQCPPSPIPCTRYVCQNPLIGCQLEVVPDGTPCDDGNLCTLGEQCQGGLCLAQVYETCDDGNPCTTDACKADTGECVHGFNTAPCDDGNACTVGDTCDGAGHCLAGTTWLLCDDHNLCTMDSCDPARGCVFTPINGLPCDDGNACTIGDRCQDGACTPTGPLFCDDGKVCTVDSCDPARGCVFEPLAAGTPCEDGSRCSIHDYCDSNGTCVAGQPLNCDDGNVCTTDSCDPATGCRHVNNNVTCDDGNACTENDQCSGGVCRGKPVNCWNNNPCLVPGCDPLRGCIYQAAAGIACDDGNACTVKDQCTNAGTCAGSPLNPDDGNPCTSEYCDPARGIIRSNVSGGSCRLPQFPGTGTCSSGVCTALCVTSCGADGSPCTYDWCAGWTCRRDASSGPACNDANGCTTADTCQSNGTCQGVPVECDDRNPCTRDSCNSTGTVAGCQHLREENGTTCPEGHCWFGVCLPL